MAVHRFFCVFLLTLFVLSTATACEDDSRRRRKKAVVVDTGIIYDVGTTTNNDPSDAGHVDDTNGPDDANQVPDDTSPVEDVDPITPDCTGCTANQVCVDGACQDIPDTCPCPLESYCSLAENRCVAGCIDDDNCSTNRICYSDTRECRAGCREDEQCGQGRICVDLTCRTGCREDAQCGAGQICETQACRTGCRHDGSCPQGQICAEQTLACREGCNQSAQCAGVQVCNITEQQCVASIFHGLGTYTTGDGDLGWHDITTDDGFHALESGPIGHNQTAWMELEVDIAEAMEVSFDWTVSSESWDRARFCIDDASCSSIDGPMFVRENGQLTDITWNTVTRELAPGVHVLRWTYVKDGSGTRHEDRAWVKNFQVDGSVTVGEVSVTNDQRYDIPDNNSAGVTSPVTVAQNGIVSTVRVDVNIVHTYRGDLRLYLDHDGQTADVFNPTGSNNDVVLTDHEVQGFAGAQANGTWGLRVVDSASSDVGYIDSWTLHLTLE